MSENKRRIPAASDDAPDMSTPYWADKFASVAVQRGRPKADVTKVSTRSDWIQISLQRSRQTALAGKAGSTMHCARLLDCKSPL
jgi:hypothetical protein